ncbi:MULTISPECIES: hypothetical protein [unclassified Methylobacterium]|uniref:lysozyme inhibitor LprI family protein n=1 Tax=unclassified Methylobacterium TaxID=2615210 RepID=UPI00226AE8D3|nr:MULTISPECIES: hypothetical protein [unclassified Methylobacterium]
MESLVCGDAALGARDEIMAKVYAAARRTEAGKSVEAKQRTWLATVQACKAVSCLAEAYDARIAELQRSEGGVMAATTFFTEKSAGNHGTLTVMGPVRGFASVSLMSNFVGVGGIEAGDVDTTATDAFLDLRNGPATIFSRRCRLTFERLDANRWKVAQAGRCDLAGGTVHAGICVRWTGHR